MIGTLIAIAGIIAPVIMWLFDRRRKTEAKVLAAPSSSFLGAFRELSPLEITVLRRVSTLCAELSVLEKRFPPNSPMNTAASNEAKARLVCELQERSLMKAAGIASLSTFRAIGQN